MTRRRRAALLAAGLAAAACAAGCTAGKAFYAGASDFGAYRDTRVAATEEARLAAAGKYLREHPTGAYVDEVKSDFAEREEAYFAACKGDVDRLERYVELFPDGPHAAEAKSAIRVKRDRANQPDALDVAAAATQERLDAMARGRERARAVLLEWLDRVIAPAVFSAPLPDGPLVVPFSLGLPSPRCTSVDPEDGVARKCVKLIEEDFSFPRAGTFVEHALLFDVSIDMDPSGAPRAIRVAGPELFTRFEETFIEARGAGDDTDRRINAIERVIESLTNVFDANVSNDSGCVKRDLAASEVLHLSCGGVDVRAIAGRDAGEDDVVHVRPSPKDAE